MKLPLSIALRFLLSSRTQTLFIVLGIAVGISVQVFIGSLITGLQSSLIETTIGSTSHITVSSRTDDRTLTDWAPIVESIRSNPAYTAVTPTVTRPAFTVENGQFETVVVRGFPFEQADAIYGFSERIVEGSVRDGGVLLGRDLVEELGLAIDDDITLLTGAGQRQRVTLTGVFDLQVASLNRSWVVTDIPTAQALFDLAEDNAITGIETQIKEVFEARRLAEELSQILPAVYEAENWKSQNEQLLTGLQGQSSSSLMIQVFVVIAVSLGIASVLSITVIQKSRQIGILKAMGISDRDASLVFLSQGILLGLIGGVLGIVIGLGLMVGFTTFALNPDGTPIVDLIISPLFLLGSGFIGIAAGSVSSLAPARRSQKLEPMEVIRNG